MQFRAVILASLLACTSAGAQSVVGVVVRVRVVDSANAPLENVAVSAIQGLNQTIATGNTDRSGVRVLQVNKRPEEFQVIARRVGFQPAAKVIGLDSRDTISISFVLRRIAQRLDTVRVTAAQSAKRQRATIDADAIAASTRPLVDVIDVIEKLRPNMTLEPPDLVGACRKLSTLFVNGKRYYFPPDGIPTSKSRRGVPTAATMAAIGAPTARPGAAVGGAPLDVIILLNSIKPEHIDFLEYHDCMDGSIQGGQSALFITLKDGVAFDINEGSYVMGAGEAESLARRIGLKRDPQFVVYEPYRNRVLGVFDAITGAPINGATITDLLSGVHATSTETGTVSLAFLQPGPCKVLIEHAGYRADTLSVNIAPTDTLPLTVVLRQVSP